MDNKLWLPGAVHSLQSEIHVNIIRGLRIVLYELNCSFSKHLGKSFFVPGAILMLGVLSLCLRKCTKMPSEKPVNVLTC